VRTRLVGLRSAPVSRSGSIADRPITRGMGEAAVCSSRRFYSAEYAITAGIAGALGLLAASFFAFIAEGATTARLLAATLAAVASARLVWVAARGGVWISQESVTSRGVLATSSIPRLQVTGVAVISDHRGVTGRLNGPTPIPLRGVAYRHRHSVGAHPDVPPALATARQWTRLPMLCHFR